jgi:hypothetical protein
MKKGGRRSQDLKVEFIEVGEMTEAQAEFIARMYFTWWKRRHEREMAEEAEREKPTKQPPGFDWVI